MQQIFISNATAPVPSANTGTLWAVNPLRTLLFVFVLGGTALPSDPSMHSASATLTDHDRTISILTREGTASVDRFSSLRARWTHADAIPVSEDTISTAAVLLDNLPEVIEPPHISPSSDGEIGLSWIKGMDRFEAILDADNHLAWITKIDGNYVAGLDVNALSPEGRGAFYGAIDEFFERA
jgi:hypothetical protein